MIKNFLGSFTLLLISMLLSGFSFPPKLYDDIQVGDQIENFGAPFCMNDNGADTWNYDQHGTNKIIFLSLFATW